MKLLATLFAATFGQDYDFYSSGEAYRFGSVGDFSHTQGSWTPQADGSAPPIDGSDADTDGNNDSQAGHLHAAGEFADTVRYLRYGHGGNRRYCHTTRNNRAVYNWTSHKYGGYFGEGRNFMECMGEELYCFIEERAHYGQIIGITAGCEQMMNHPSVTIQDQQALISTSYTQINAIKNNYNQEAARGGANRHGFFTYYGLGGCLAMPAQNGHHMVNDRLRPPARGSWPEAAGTQTSELRAPAYHRQGVDSESWRSYKWLNYYRNFHGGYGQNQCLRFPKQRLQETVSADSTAGNRVTVGDHTNTCTANTDGSSNITNGGCQARVANTHIYNSPGNLLPFGVSVCRACCVAEFAIDASFDATSTAGSTMLCNYPPDIDTNIVSQTDEQFEELIPRFDMAGAAYNAFQMPNENSRQFMADRDNNLFVHGSWCDEAGPARGCARVPRIGTQDGPAPTPFEWNSATSATSYVWGADLTNHTHGSGRDYLYTCVQAPRVVSGSAVGLQPIGSSMNRDWCPGRPWLATDPYDLQDTSQRKPTNSGNYNIIG